MAVAKSCCGCESGDINCCRWDRVLLLLALLLARLLLLLLRYGSPASKHVLLALLLLLLLRYGSPASKHVRLRRRTRSKPETTTPRVQGISASSLSRRATSSTTKSAQTFSSNLHPIHPAKEIPTKATWQVFAPVSQTTHRPWLLPEQYRQTGLRLRLER